MASDFAQGFGIVPNWLVREGDISAYALLVYVALSGRANRRGEAWPSIATIAREARCSPTTARKALEELRSVGLVTWQSRTVDGRSSTNVYRIRLAAEGKWGSASRTLPLREADPPPPSGGPEEDTLKKTQVKKTHAKPNSARIRPREDSAPSEEQLQFLFDCMVMVGDTPDEATRERWAAVSAQDVSLEIESLWVEIEHGGNLLLQEALELGHEHLSQRARRFIADRLEHLDYRDRIQADWRAS